MIEEELHVAVETPPAQNDATNYAIAPSLIDLNALWVVKRLRAKGFEAYLTGGCVRDLLLGKNPKDFDVATSAKPEEIRKSIRNSRLIGKRFLLAHVFFPGRKIIETATFRANPEDVVEDMPPSDLLVTKDNVYGSLEQDALRRDFTINGLFYDPMEGKVIDFVKGLEDLDRRLIRSIGDPDIRFREDPVRILRAIRFAGRLGFDIEESTLAAMKTHAAEITRCAPARVLEEVIRLLTSGNAEYSLAMCEETGILNALMPELVESLNMELVLPSDTPVDQIENLSASISIEARRFYWKDILRALDAVSKRDVLVSPAVALAASLLPAYSALEKSDKNERNWVDKLCVNWSQSLRLPRKDQDNIRILLSAVHLFTPEKTKLKSAHYLVKKPWFREALLLFIVDLLAKNQSLEQIDVWKELAHSEGALYRQEKLGDRKVFAFRASPPGIRRKKMSNRPPRDYKQAVRS